MNEVKIAGHRDLDEKNVIMEYNGAYDMYRKLLIINEVYHGEMISKNSKYVHTRKTLKKT